MPDHSPEPWTLEIEGSLFPARDAEGEGVFADEIGPMDEADARRIVACVNFCRNLDTDWLEKYVADQGLPDLPRKVLYAVPKEE